VIGQLKAMVEGRKQRPARGEVLAARPQRHPAVEFERHDESGLMLLKVPRRSDRFGNLVARWFKLPDHKKIELDEIGSDVWEWCDGKAGVGEISKKISQKYRLNMRQSEASVTAYLKMLAERRLIGLRAGEKSRTGAAPKRKRA
jgi:hypothetical protein